jgi:microcystin-dependent protein
LRFCPYGLGDASTTFNVPNLKGKVIVGANTSDAEFDVLGVAGAVGEKTHLLTGAESGIKAHAHTIANAVGATAGNNWVGTNPSFNNNINSTGTKAAEDASSAHNNIQPYLVMNFIIKT